MPCHSVYFHKCAYEKPHLISRNNFLSLDVYYGELTYEFIEQTKAYTTDKFFSKYTFDDFIKLL